MTMDEQNMTVEPVDTQTVETPLLPSDATPEQIANAAAGYLDDKKAKDIKIIPMRGKTDICDFMVLATGNSSTHVQTLAGEVEYRLKQSGISPIHVEGRDNKAWSVLDYAQVMVHIFTKQTREFYNLEKLYAD